MSLAWTESTEGLDWGELEALYRAAPWETRMRRA